MKAKDALRQLWDYITNIMTKHPLSKQEYIIIEEGGECLTLNILHTNTLRSNPPTSIHKTSSNKSIPLSEQKTVDIS